ncbi:DEAD/DEAH box helicase [Sorangium sp. So ce394]|uniref:DEAD/DEAH box helicase n=1 Tax=Sorangium sp. So ce394 TaxID=3133310 RepID=UPI003F5AEB15
MTSFDRLTPAVQYQILNTLGFRELRPVQEMTIDAVLDGRNCVVLAPTAGGKTEAAFFPLLSAMEAGDWRPVSVLYLSPIRALLNNQEARVARYAETIGRRVFKWHGDTGAPARRRFIQEPADILLTTPEALEAMLMSPKVPAARLFAGLRAVVIDEIHAFAAGDRGSHLAALLERISRFCRFDVQRIGLSATVGNPEEILRWIRGHSEREGVVVSPPRLGTTPKLALDYVASVPNAAKVIAALHPGKKRLVFVDSRRGAEELGRELLAGGVDTHIVHGSLAPAERRDAERAFQEKQDCVIVSTSAMELGIDVGDLDHVLQIDCPATVASFQQRMGRTGRRPGTTPNCTFLATKPEAVLQAAALLRLHRRGYVEPVRPSRRAFHIMAHQLLALSIQLEGVGVRDWFAWLDGATPFAEVTAEQRAALVAFMLEQGILVGDGGRLSLGPEGERRYGRRNFAELYAVFSTPRLITVHWGTRELGTIDAEFLESLDSDQKRAAFSLGGRPWQVIRVDWGRGLCAVEPADHARAARWTGAPGFLGFELVQAMREVLVSDDADPWWSRRAAEAIAGLRAEATFLRDAPAPVVEGPNEVTWWTYIGGRGNMLLARMIEAELGGRCVVRNTSITCKEAAGMSAAGVRELVRRLGEEGRPGLADARRFARTCAGRMRLSKFQPCLPDELLDEFLIEALDIAAARGAVEAAS